MGVYSGLEHIFSFISLALAASGPFRSLSRMLHLIAAHCLSECAEESHGHACCSCAIIANCVVSCCSVFCCSSVVLPRQTMSSTGLIAQLATFCITPLRSYNLVPNCNHPECGSSHLWLDNMWEDSTRATGLVKGLHVGDMRELHNVQQSFIFVWMWELAHPHGHGSAHFPRPHTRSKTSSTCQWHLSWH